MHTHTHTHTHIYIYIYIYIYYLRYSIYILYSIYIYTIYHVFVTVLGKSTASILAHKTEKSNLDDLRSCTVYVDSIKSFICPTNAHKLL